MPETPKKPATKRKTKAEKEAELAAPPVPEGGEASPSDQVLDGVFVVKQTGEGGAIDVQVIKNGNLGVLEIESLLKLGLKRFQEQMGFS